MANLKVEHPDVQQRFDDGFRVIRRSDRLWAGLSSDLIIEQALMRSLKTSGGLTRGRGMTEPQRLLWLLSMPACAEVNHVMQEVTGVNYNTGEQNKDISKARQCRDWKDTLAVIQYLQERNPFCNDSSLRSIATRIHIHLTVNVDTAHAVGATILKSMDGIKPDEHTFRRKEQVVTLGMKLSIKIDGEELESAFKYELCSYPATLFDSSLLLR